MTIKSFKERISSLYYTHGLICASHPLSVFALTFSFVFLCCYPLSKLPLPGNAPLHYCTPFSRYSVPKKVNVSPDTAANFDLNSEKYPIWYNGPSAGYILQVVVKATISPWKRKLLCPSDAFRTPLSRTFDILEKIQAKQISTFVGPYSITDLCLQVSETLASKDINNILPQYNCLIVSPANLWKLQHDFFKNDATIMKTVYNTGNILADNLLLKDVVFGVPWHQSGMSRFYVRNRQRVVSFAITVIMSKFDEKFVKELSTELKIAFPSPSPEPENYTYASQSMTHIYFKASNYFFLEYTPLIVAYVVLFLYIYFSVRKIEMVKSKWGLALASVATVVASLFMSIGICTFFGLQPILLGSKIYEIFPYLVVIVGLENVLILTKSVSSTNVHQDVKFRVAEGLCKEGWGITKNLLYELLILLFGFFTFVPEIQEFCLFAVVGLLSDFFLQMMFFATVLSIDIRRLELTDLKSQRSFHDTDNIVEHPEPLMSCPYINVQRSRSSNSPRTRLESHGCVPDSNSEYLNTSSSTSRRVKLIELVARYRMVQRLLMFCTTVWIILLIYQTGLASYMLHVTMNATLAPAPIRNALFSPATHNHQHENSHQDSPDQNDVLNIFHDAFLVKHDNSEHWRKLRNSHWPTLFGYYNISLWNRYVTILPPIRLSIVIHPEEAIKKRHPSECSKLDSSPPDHKETSPLDPESGLHMLQKNWYYPRSKHEFYITVVLGITSTVITVYLTIWLYGCFCSRNYADKSRSRRGEEQRSRSYSKRIRPGMPVLLTGHCQQVECISSNGNQIVSSCLGGEIRVWDSSNGQCLTVIPSTATANITNRDSNLDYCSDLGLDLNFAMRSLSNNESTAENNDSVNEDVEDDEKKVSESGYNFTKFYKEPSQTASPVQDGVELVAEPADQCSGNAEKRKSSSSLSPPNHRKAPIWCLTCQDNIIVVGCADGAVEVWDIKGVFKCAYKADTSAVTSVVFRGGRIVAARLNGTLDFIMLTAFIASNLVVTKPGQKDSIPTKTYIRGHFRARSGHWHGTEEGLFNWDDIIQCTLTNSYKAHQRVISDLKSEGGRVVTGSGDHTLKVYKLDDSVCLYTLHGHSAPVTCLYLDKDTPGAASGCDHGSVRVWDLLTGACVLKLTNNATNSSTWRNSISSKDFYKPILSVVTTPVYVIGSSADRCVCVWERRTGLLQHSIKLDTLAPSYLAMLTSNLLVSTGQGKIYILDVNRGELLNILQLSEQDTCTSIQQAIVVNSSLVICDFGNQLRCVPFPSVLDKVK